MKNVAELVRKAPWIERETIPHDWPLPDNYMGIEVEVEGGEGVRFPVSSSLFYWDTKRDGSLQNGKEYVLKNPQKDGVLRAAIKEIMEAGVYRRSLTGSTHIHMNMLEAGTTPEVLKTLVLLVYILEPLLYASGDASREWCGYANRLRSGPDAILTGVLADELNAEVFRRNYSRSSSIFGRYYGLNMAALLDYGSLEFRYFPTATSEEELVGWVELVQSIKKAALSIGSREHLANVVEEESLLYEMLNQFFGKWQHLFSTLGSYSEIRNNFRKACITGTMPEQRYQLFDSFKVFGDGKFAHLIDMDKVQSPTPDPILVIRGYEDVIPSANDLNVDMHTVMVYDSSVYVIRARFHGGAREWWMISNLTSDQITSQQSLVEALITILNNPETYPIGRYTHNFIRGRLSTMIDIPAAAADAEELDLDPDYNDED